MTKRTGAPNGYSSHRELNINGSIWIKHLAAQTMSGCLSEHDRTVVIRSYPPQSAKLQRSGEVYLSFNLRSVSRKCLEPSDLYESR